jgi:hypothetical protein
MSSYLQESPRLARDIEKKKLCKSFGLIDQPSATKHAPPWQSQSYSRLPRDPNPGNRRFHLKKRKVLLAARYTRSKESRLGANTNASSQHHVDVTTPTELAPIQHSFFFHHSAKCLAFRRNTNAALFMLYYYFLASSQVCLTPA